MAMTPMSSSTLASVPAATTPAPIRLYSYFRSSAAFRVRIALALKALAYETVPVHLPRNEQHSERFALLNPSKTVPLLEMDGLRLTQSMAIIEYLDEVHPQPALLPADAPGRAAVRSLAQLVACDIHPLNNLRVLKYLVHSMAVGEVTKNAWYLHWCRTGLEAFEQQLAMQKTSGASVFCYGDTPTLADCCLIPQIFNAQRFGVPLNGLPRTMAVFAACMDLPAFQQAQPSACVDFEA